MRMSQEYEQLLLKNQLCFPMYACSRKIVGSYTPYLKPLGLTYTQYIVMMVMWEHKSLNVGELGKKLYLDTGTLSPLLKSMEEKQLLTRTRQKGDERVVTIEITQKGMDLQKEAVFVPAQMGNCLNISQEEAKTLYNILYKLLSQN